MTRPGFLFPVRVLGALFRGKFLAGLRALARRDELDISRADFERDRRDERTDLTDTIFQVAIADELRMFASDERLRSVSPCSNWSRRLSSSKLRVTLSSISTKPLTPAASVAALSLSRTGAICTRSNCPERVVVTNWADGLAAPRPSRWCTLSTAWATSCRSNTT